MQAGSRARPGLAGWEASRRSSLPLLLADSRAVPPALALLSNPSLNPATFANYAAQEQRAAARREQDFARDEVRRYYAQQRATDAASGAAERDGAKRAAREAREREELDAAVEALRGAERERRLAAARDAEGDARAAALAQRRAAEEAAAREAQRLREDSAELRE